MAALGTVLCALAYDRSRLGSNVGKGSVLPVQQWRNVEATLRRCRVLGDGAWGRVCRVREALAVLRGFCGALGLPWRCTRRWRSRKRPWRS